MDKDPKRVESDIKEQIKEYRKLQNIANDEAFDTFFNNQLKLVADKLVWLISNGKDGANVKDWNDFCLARGEIVSRLQPIQEVYGAEYFIKYLEDQLRHYYKEQDLTQ